MESPHGDPETESARAFLLLYRTKKQRGCKKGHGRKNRGKRTAAAEPGARCDIAEARKNIDRIDREMAELFAERMQAAAVVAAYKEEHGLPVEDKAREAEMIARNTERLPPAYRPYYRNFLVGTITESSATSACSSADCAWRTAGWRARSRVATMRIFGEPGEKVACPDFATAYRAWRAARATAPSCRSRTVMRATSGRLWILRGADPDHQRDL